MIYPFVLGCLCALIGIYLAGFWGWIGCIGIGIELVTLISLEEESRA